jgi:16S rRNA (guanine527-N7)-methyltransferase
MSTPRARLEELAAMYGLRPAAVAQLEAVLAALAAAPISLTAVDDPARAVDVHVADSLVALDVPQVRSARAIADLGSGGGFPGLVLAAALPEAHVTLVESVGKKCAHLEATADGAGLGNVDVVNARAEDWYAGAGTQDLVTARAVASLPVLVEYASPLLRVGGALLAWKGRPDPQEEADGAAAAAILGLEAGAARPMMPYAGAGERRLYLYLKVGPTPNGYPRRAGMARKRPLRAST